MKAIKYENAGFYTLALILSKAVPAQGFKVLVMFNLVLLLRAVVLAFYRIFKIKAASGQLLRSVAAAEL